MKRWIAIFGLFVPLSALSAGKVIQDGGVPPSPLMLDPSSSAGTVLGISSFAFDRNGAVLPEDRGNVTDHFYFDGTQLVDTKGVTFTQLGTVPQGFSTQTFPSGFGGNGRGVAGPFSATNRYRLAAGTNPWSVWSGGAGLVILVYVQNTAATNRLINGLGTANSGWSSYAGATGSINFAPYGGGGDLFDPGINKRPTLGSMTVSCFGQIGSSGYATVNGIQQRKLASGLTRTDNTTGVTYFGTDFDGATNPFNGSLVEGLMIAPVASIQEMDALCTYYTNQANGVRGFQSLTNSDSTYFVGSTRFTAPTNMPRINNKGVMVEPSAINYFANPLAPANQTMTARSVTEPITCWMEGAGSIALTAGTFSGSGLPCTVTSASPCFLSSTGGGTINAVVTAPATTANCTTSAVVLELNTTGGTYPSNVQCGTQIRIPNKGLGGSAGHVSFDLYAKFAAAASGSDRPVVNDLSLGAPSGTTGGVQLDYIAASKIFRLTVSNITVNSAVQAFNAGDKITIVIDYDRTGVRLTVGGAQTSGGVPAPFSAGAFINLGSWVAPLSTPVTYCGMAWFPEKQWAGSFANISFGPVTNPGSIRTPIACLGDSLTYGTGSILNTYAYSLQNALPGYTVDDHGIGGQPLQVDTQGGSIHTRYWRDIEPAGYVGVSVLAGTNDVNSNQSSASTTPYLQSIYDRARSVNGRLVPITMPPSSTFTAPQITEWTATNTWIRNYGLTNSIVYVDIATLFNNGSNALIPACDSGDHLHLTQTCYDRMANMVAAIFKGTTCSQGAIGAACVCGVTSADTGFCCSGVWSSSSC